MSAVLQSPTSLLDARGRPLRDLRLSVIEACNFRCTYCMPAEQVPEDYGLDAAARLSFDEIETLVRGFARLGVNKLRLTGGEPLLRKRLPELIARLSQVPGIDDLALTTNGSLLATQAGALHKAGLRRLTVSLDALDSTLFRRLSGGRGELAAVLAGIRAAMDAGFASLKINCVVQRGVNEDQVLPLVEHFRHSGHVLRFIEYMDVGTCNDWQRERVVSSVELRDRIAAHWPLQRWIHSIVVKWPSVTGSVMARARWASSVPSAKHSAAIAIAPGFLPMVVCIPACSPRKAPTCAPCFLVAMKPCSSTSLACGRSVRTATANCVRQVRPAKAGRLKCS